MVMAATLIHIKSKMLVPVEPTEAEGEEEAEDPRDALVQRLLEFQRYKEAAGVLHQQAQIRAATWTRPDAVLPKFDDAGEEMLEAGLFDLIAPSRSCSTAARRCSRTRSSPRASRIEQRIESCWRSSRRASRWSSWSCSRAQETKADMIVTFLALLELIRLKRVKVYQRGMFGPIRVFRPVGPEEGAPAGGRTRQR